MRQYRFFSGTPISIKHEDRPLRLTFGFPDFTWHANQSPFKPSMVKDTPSLV
jgi:hypothetical protein